MEIRSLRILLAGLALIINLGVDGQVALADEDENYGFGIGFATIFYQSTYKNSKFGRPKIESAEVVDGKVRVTDERRHESRLILEVHIVGASTLGGFAALLVDDESRLTGMGLGLIKQWKSNQDGSKTTYINLGIGWVYENKVRELGPGVTADNPPPGGETEVRYKEASRTSPMLMVSTTF